MARKKKHGSHENHERWMVSYADFITLMFAFFVVMFASSQTDKGKAQQVSESVKGALENGQLASAIAGILGGTPGLLEEGNAMRKGPGGAQKAKPTEEKGKQYLAELAPSLAYLNEVLKAEIAAGKVQIRMEPRGLVVSLKEAAFFATGEDVISPSSYESIGKIAESLRSLPNPVRLEGHTDSVPIHNTRFHSNWELSVARGVTMLNLLSERFKVPSKQLSIAGYADNQPQDTNDTEAGRARNRRVDIVILNKLGYVSEPNASAKPAVTAPAHGAPAAPAATAIPKPSALGAQAKH